MEAPKPLRIALPRPMPTAIGVGGFLKNTVTVIRSDTAWVSPIIGTLDQPETITAFEATLEALIVESGAKPKFIAHDLHPDFPSTHHAQKLAADRRLKRLPVQHHHAHIAAVQAEYSLEDPVIGLALDGFGLGPNGEAWGGELLWVDACDWQRLGHLGELRQPGGDLAARQPWRMAAAALHALGQGEEIPTRFAAQAQADKLPTLLDKGLNAPLTSSAGRLFDAACGLLGVYLMADFEGQAPMALEKAVTAVEGLEQGWQLSSDGVLDFKPLLKALAALGPEDLEKGANLFHGTLIEGLSAWVQWGGEREGCRLVAFGGGCFLNAVLCDGLKERLEASGFSVFAPKRLSPGDPAVSLGQAWVAANAKERGRLT